MLNIWLLVPQHHEAAGEYVVRSLKSYEGRGYADSVFLLQHDSALHLQPHDYNTAHRIALVVQNDVEASELIQYTALAHHHTCFSIIVVGTLPTNVLSRFYELYRGKKLCGVWMLENAMCPVQATNSMCANLFERLERQAYCICEVPNVASREWDACNTITFGIIVFVSIVLLLAYCFLSL